MTIDCRGQSAKPANRSQSMNIQRAADQTVGVITYHVVAQPVAQVYTRQLSLSASGASYLAMTLNAEMLTSLHTRWCVSPPESTQQTEPLNSQSTQPAIYQQNHDTQPLHSALLSQEDNWSELCCQDMTSPSLEPRISHRIMGDSSGRAEESNPTIAVPSNQVQLVEYAAQSHSVQWKWPPPSRSPFSIARTCLWAEVYPPHGEHILLSSDQ